MKHNQLTPQFVDVMPDALQDGVLYISMVYALAAHRCACGCGEEVVTPFSPTDWYLLFDGERVSLKPSIGNWNFACRSHYWIKGNRVRWARDLSQTTIDEGRARDRSANEAYYGDDPRATVDQPDVDSASASSATASAFRKLSPWKWVSERWRKR